MGMTLWCLLALDQSLDDYLETFVPGMEWSISIAHLLISRTPSWCWKLARYSDRSKFRVNRLELCRAALALTHRECVRTDSMMAAKLWLAYRQPRIQAVIISERSSMKSDWDLGSAVYTLPAPYLARFSGQDRGMPLRTKEMSL
jgi:hypothetical protein